MRTRRDGMVCARAHSRATSVDGDFRDLEVWKRSYALTLGIYKATREFPTSERYASHRSCDVAAVFRRIQPRRRHGRPEILILHDSPRSHELRLRSTVSAHPRRGSGVR
jgi:hypothetical protein